MQDKTEFPGPLKNRAILSLGSNLEDRAAYLKKARDAIFDHPQIELFKITHPLDNPPLLEENQPRFLNQLLEIQTGLTPEELLSFLKETERKLGRKKRKRYGPREIDLDIVAYSKEHRTSESLTLPHPGVRNRQYLHNLLRELDITPEEISSY